MQDYPEYPEFYTGVTFEQSISSGGYGDPTTSMYDVATGEWRAYGAISQSAGAAF